MQITPAGLQALYINFTTQYQAAYLEPEIFYNEFCTTFTSSTTEEDYVWMDVLPQLRVWLGERFVSNLQGRVYKLPNLKFEDTFGVQRDQIEDDKYNVFGPRVTMLGRAAKKWPDQIMANTIAAGTTALCFDGNPYFFNAHPQDAGNPNSPTYQNRFDSSANGGSVSMPLNAQNLLTLVEAIMDYKGADGAPLGIKPTKLVVPSKLWGTAKQLCELEYIAQVVGSNVAQMQSNVMQGWLKPVRFPYLTDVNRWYVVCGDEPIMPFAWQLRNAPEMTFLNRPDDQYSFLRDQYLFGVRARGNGGYTLPFLAATASI